MVFCKFVVVEDTVKQYYVEENQKTINVLNIMLNTLKFLFTGTHFS